MILNFGARNFFSFKEGFDISFELGNTCPKDISNGKSITNILCVKGANSSGKTNVLKALNFITNFITSSFNMKPNTYIQFDPYFGNEHDSEFYITFSLGKIIYRYEAVMTDIEVKRETLYRKSKRETKVIERIGYSVPFAVKEFEELKFIKMRANVSLFSMAMQYDLKSIKQIHDSFTRVISNVDYLGLLTQTHELDFLNRFYYENPEVFEFAKKIIMKFDPSIHDIYVSKTLGDDGKPTYTPWFSFEINNENDVLSLNLQSSGTKSLYKQLGSYKVVLSLGGLLLLDEFDINLHPHILPHLLDIFINEDDNPLNAQLIFTTHNTEILDFLGKHRTYLVNKNRTESYCYRLDEIPSDILRNDRPITPAYNQGKIGGVPNL
ncbi:ATP-binding protein [Pectobacterium polaris]|uniref:ATP-binding protein n=1 Tax=Pectobacterium polaris TaxID=2042057 RepID=A0AAW4NVA5_9GAMM|nr:ATP-binding protein [Pectobacterium polaris]MBW5891021.1 ATP-binding protein [Pectobacterium polaris]